MKHRSDLKHTSTTKSRAEEQENKARDEFRDVAYELRMVKDELQIAREELKAARGELWVVRVKQQADKEELQKAFSAQKTYLSSPPPPPPPPPILVSPSTGELLTLYLAVFDFD